jgi:hypothetical protein
LLIMETGKTISKTKNKKKLIINKN